jgi:hypothetical protein
MTELEKHTATWPSKWEIDRADEKLSLEHDLNYIARKITHTARPRVSRDPPLDGRKYVAKRSIFSPSQTSLIMLIRYRTYSSDSKHVRSFRLGMQLNSPPLTEWYYQEHSSLILTAGEVKVVIVDAKTVITRMLCKSSNNGIEDPARIEDIETVEIRMLPPLSFLQKL